MKNGWKNQILIPEITVPTGMKIPAIESYGSNLLSYGISDDGCWINHIGCVASGNKDALLVVQTDDNHFSLLPGPEFSPRLYRGQTDFHRECVPSLFRKLTQIKYLTDLLKKYEFYKLMAWHPIVRVLQGWCIDGKYFNVDMEGLSAHYEFATSMMDVTRSKDIAMFFALCKKNKKSNRYEPITDEDHEVVLYTVDMKAMLKNRNSDFHVIGFQALPRPDAQKAYSFFVSHKQNFNTCPFVNYKKFRVNRKQSEKYFEMFEGGEKLFPNDIVDEMAWEIRQSMEIDREVLEVCFERHWMPKAWANALEVGIFLNEFGYVVAEKHLEFSDEVKRKIVEKWNNNSPLNANRVKCRFNSEPA